MRPIAVALLSVLLLATSLSAKGPTVRIVIRDTAAGTVAEIKDRALLDHFQVWAGRGTSSGSPGQLTEGTEGFIVDWPAGIATDRPGQLRRYELQFYVSRKKTSVEELAYVVLYENDPATGRGFVYLPGRSDEHFRLNVSSIIRDLEGQWLYASRAWQSAVATVPVVRR